MKVLTVCIVCNDEYDDISKIIESCLLLKEDVEVLILGDKENPRYEKAKEYAKTYPEDVIFLSLETKPIVSTIIEQVNGLYFKLIDGKDILDTPILVKVVETCKDLLRIQANLDMMICDYQYLGKKAKKGIVSYSHVFPLDKVFQWHQTKGFKASQKIAMEAVILKTNLLKKIDFDIPYQYSFHDCLLLKALQQVKSMYYLDQSLVYITMGEPRSISLGEYHDRLKYIINTTDIANVESRKFRNYVINHINYLFLYYFVHCMKEDIVEYSICKEEIIEYMVMENPLLYRSIKKTGLFKLYTSDIKLSAMFISKKYKNIK